jgi:acyl carrier protein
MNNREKAIKIIVEVSGINAADIVTGDETTVTLGFDSLDELEAIMALEDKFNIEISDDLLDGCKTVNDIVKILEKHGIDLTAEAAE